MDASAEPEARKAPSDSSPRDTAAPTVTPAKRQRVSQACENCRSQKTRCNPSHVDGVCERCLRTNKTCKLHVPIQQNHESRGKRRSLARVESRIEELYSLIGQKGDPLSDRRRASLSEAASQSPANASASQDKTARAQQLFEEIEGLRGGRLGADGVLVSGSGAAALPKLAPDANLPYDKLKGTSAPDEQAEEKLGEILVCQLGFPPCIQKESYMKICILLPNKGEELLENWRSLNRNFPFVFIPDSWTPLDLVRQKPLLAAAIFAATTAFQRPFQVAFDDLARAAFGRRLLQQGEKSLELLQALLVYLSYHHHFFRPETQQVYTYLNAAASMAIEIGLLKPVKRTQYPPSTLELDRLRALLGLYYLSTIISGIDFNRPRFIKYTSHLDTAASLIATHATTASCATLLPGMVSLLRIAEDTADSLRNSECPPGNLPLSISHLISRLSAWDTSHATQELTFLTPTRHFLTIVIHESVLFLPSPPSSLIVHQELTATLTASRLFLDGILASPSLIISLQTLPTFTHIGAAITALVRLCRPLPSDRFQEASWDASARRDAACAFEYIEAVRNNIRRQDEALRPSQRIGLDKLVERMGRGMAAWVIYGGPGVQGDAGGYEAALVFMGERERLEREKRGNGEANGHDCGVPATSTLPTTAPTTTAPIVQSIQGFDATNLDSWMWDDGIFGLLEMDGSVANST